MDFSTCYNCGEPGHFARDCPSPATKKRQPAHFHAPQRRADQAEINARGIRMVRDAFSDALRLPTRQPTHQPQQPQQQSAEATEPSPDPATAVHDPQSASAAH